MNFDRKIYFDLVRKRPFGGALTQDQINGQEAILARWEKDPLSDDLRHLAYPLATTKHETANTMQPIEEYGKGAGMSYGKPDAETGQVYYGRGFVQLTWRNNYAKASAKLDLSGIDDLEWHANNALHPGVAADVMFLGMSEGWFRSSGGKPETLNKYFSELRDDPFGAREIINGDKNTVPSWSNGVSIGKLIAEYHSDFLAALRASAVEGPEPVPVPEPEPPSEVAIAITIRIEAPPGVVVRVEQVEAN
jgi:putative chitinase